MLGFTVGVATEKKTVCIFLCVQHLFFAISSPKATDKWQTESKQCCL